MVQDPTKANSESAGLGGALRVTAGLAIIALALLAGLAVMDVIPREQLTDYGTRVVLLAVIVALACAGIAGLIRIGRRSS
jgi:hypothetical protein